MSDLTEAVARQLCLLDGADPDHRPPFGRGMPGRKPPRWMLYEHVARAVIDTVRAHDKTNREAQA